MDVKALQQNQSIIVDCRRREDYLNCHLAGSVNIAAAELFERMHELPIKATPLNIVVDDITRSAALSFFNERQFNLNSILSWQAVKEQEALSFASGLETTHFWQPSDFIKAIVAGRWFEFSQPDVLDIACGSGRDAMYMAKHGAQVFAIDNSATALARLQRSVRHYQLRVTSAIVDVERSLDEQQTVRLPVSMPKTYDIVIMCRYLHRPLYPQLRRWLKPQGFLCIQTFLQGCEKISSPRNPNFLLAHDELAETFQDLTIISNTVEHLPDGRPLSRFIALNKVID